MVFPAFYHVAFPENALFKKTGFIWWSPPPSLLPGECSMDKQDRNFFNLKSILYGYYYRSNNTTGSSFIIAEAS